MCIKIHICILILFSISGIKKTTFEVIINDKTQQDYKNRMLGVSSMNIELPKIEEFKNNTYCFEDLSLYRIVFSDNSFITIAIDFSDNLTEDESVIECIYEEIFYKSMNIDDYEKAKEEVLNKIKEITETKKLKVIRTEWN